MLWFLRNSGLVKVVSLVICRERKYDSVEEHLEGKYKDWQKKLHPDLVHSKSEVYLHIISSLCDLIVLLPCALLCFGSCKRERM